jgi:uncharacterized protein
MKDYAHHQPFDEGRMTAPIEALPGLKLAVSLDCAAALSARGKRTWWRRIERGQIEKLPSDSAGRCRVLLSDALKHAVISLDQEDIAFLLRADAGDPDAQDDIGQLFLQANLPNPAHYWLRLAAKQGHSNAMQVLAGCYARGDGVEKDEHIAMKWLYEAAARGHSLAQEQLRVLTSRFK